MLKSYNFTLNLYQFFLFALDCKRLFNYFISPYIITSKYLTIFPLKLIVGSKVEMLVGGVGVSYMSFLSMINLSIQQEYR